MKSNRGMRYVLKHPHPLTIMKFLSYHVSATLSRCHTGQLIYCVVANCLPPTKQHQPILVGTSSIVYSRNTPISSAEKTRARSKHQRPHCLPSLSHQFPKPTMPTTAANGNICHQQLCVLPVDATNFPNVVHSMQNIWILSLLDPHSFPRISPRMSTRYYWSLATPHVPPLLQM